MDYINSRPHNSENLASDLADYSLNLASDLTGKMKLARQIANIYAEQKSQTDKADPN
jgi:hypothetical protein